DLDPADVMAQFVELQTLLRSLLDKAVYLEWNSDKTAILFGSWIKINVGDILVMLVAHTERHMAQAMRVKEGLSL
ncbi:MAG: DinB family protein, partial [Rudanella sp.]|nr:DinB family protein [Rudanella sp.]